MLSESDFQILDGTRPGGSLPDHATSFGPPAAFTASTGAIVLTLPVVTTDPIGPLLVSYKHQMTIPGVSDGPSNTMFGEKSIRLSRSAARTRTAACTAKFAIPTAT